MQNLKSVCLQENFVIIVFTAQEEQNPTNDEMAGTAAYVLLLPGPVLDISALNTAHKFRERGNKEGAVAAIKKLEAAGLGMVKEERATRGTAKDCQKTV